MDYGWTTDELREACLDDQAWAALVEADSDLPGLRDLREALREVYAEVDQQINEETTRLVDEGAPHFGRGRNRQAPTSPAKKRLVRERSKITLRMNDVKVLIRDHADREATTKTQMYRSLVRELSVAACHVVQSDDPERRDEATQALRDLLTERTVPMAGGEMSLFEMATTGPWFDEEDPEPSAPLPSIADELTVMFRSPSFSD